MIIRIWFSLLLTLCLALALPAQAPIRYTLDLAAIARHELHVSAEFPALPRQVLAVRMPRASPGRYAEHNFAKNVYSVRAFDGQGRPLTVYRAAPEQWDVAGHDGFVRLEYTLFGNHADGTYSGIDNRKVHLNMPASFVYAVGQEQRPVELAVDLSAHPGWTVATQLQILGNNRFLAPNYYYFYDSPTLIGDIDYRRWPSASYGRDFTIELAMMHEGTDEELDRYAAWVQAIVEEVKAIFGELPAFDFGRYTFLCSYNPWVYGDGMEHRNSTVCTGRGSLAANAQGFIGTVAHEFFHCWNVERIRPRSLEPFDFDRANMSEALWFAEGFTSYYDDLVLTRAGIQSPADYARGLTGPLNYVLNSPGRRYRSPVEMSYAAPFVDAATAVDEDNFANTFISYYTYGAVLGLVLDLELRTRYPGVTLDDFMRRVWQAFGRPEIPYTLPDLEQTLADVTGDAAFAGQFFRESIYGSALPDVAALLDRFGVVARPRDAKTAGFYGLRLAYGEEGATVQGTVLETNPLYAAGIGAGDRILELAGRPLDSAEAFDAIRKDLRIGREYRVRYVQNGIETTGSFVAAPDPALEVMLLEDTGREPTDAQLELRRKWLKK